MSSKKKHEREKKDEKKKKHKESAPSEPTSRYEEFHFIDTAKPVWNYSRFQGDDIANFQNGTLYRAYDVFGSHAMEVMQALGYYFAVWAPNASYVSVIGNFNDWDTEAHPLYVRLDKSGIWEGFIPHFPQGQAYKYHIHGFKGIKVDKEIPTPTSGRCAP